MNESHAASAAPSGRKKTPLWLLLLLDLLLAGALLCVFALFHHVIPYTRGASQGPIGTIQRPADQPSGPVALAQDAENGGSEEPAPEPETESGYTPIVTPKPTPEPTPEPTPDTRTEWQKKFAAHFTDEVVVTDHSYSSPQVSIDITTYQEVIDGYNQVFYVADIYIAQVENFQSWAGNGSFTSYFATPMEELAQSCDALLAINGDYCNAQVQWGFFVRNGELYNTDQTLCDICVLYYDGTMETYDWRDYKVDDILARSPYQVWKFGPQLLDENGDPLPYFNTSEAIAIGNPRSGIGYYEPGHYCFVTCDGRHEEWSRGLTISQYAQLFHDLGCKVAYNLDGGASATMAFMGSLYNRQSSERDVGDILIIREVGPAGA